MYLFFAPDSDGMCKCAQSYHHFPSISDTTRILKHFLKPGSGALLVVDLARDDSAVSPHNIATTETKDVSLKPHQSLEPEPRIPEPNPLDRTPEPDISGDMHISPIHQTEALLHSHSPSHGSTFHSHSHSHIVAHKGGFTEPEIKNAFAVAGLEEFDWDIIGEFDPVRGNRGRKLRLFLAKGTRPTD